MGAGLPHKCHPALLQHHSLPASAAEGHFPGPRLVQHRHQHLLHLQHHFVYNTSKAATVHLSKMLAHEVTSSGLKIRINNIAPGVFPSEMMAQSNDEKQQSALPKEKYEQKVPAGRPGKEEDMASTILFAAANQQLNGQTVVIDGGYVLAAGAV